MPLKHFKNRKTNRPEKQPLTILLHPAKKVFAQAGWKTGKGKEDAFKREQIRSTPTALLTTLIVAPAIG
jgi:hypothetical protein